MPILMHEHNGVRLYHEYSTIAEGPLCPAMTREEFTAHYESQGGVDLAERLARADAHAIKRRLKESRYAPCECDLHRLRAEGWPV